MKDSFSSLTVADLVAQRMKECGISRSQLVQALGYANVAKGLRRLDVFLKTLDSPSDGFVTSLLEVLVIDWSEYRGAQAASRDALKNDAALSFRPHLRFCLNLTPRPWFAAQIVSRLVTMPVPAALQELSFEQEIAAVLAAAGNWLSASPFRKKVAGFRYFREVDYCMVFDAEFRLLDVAHDDQIEDAPADLGSRFVALLCGDDHLRRPV